MKCLALQLQLADVLNDHRLQVVHDHTTATAEQEDWSQFKRRTIGNGEVSDAWWETRLGKRYSNLVIAAKTFAWFRSRIRRRRFEGQVQETSAARKNQFKIEIAKDSSSDQTW